MEKPRKGCLVFIVVIICIFLGSLFFTISDTKETDGFLDITLNFISTFVAFMCCAAGFAFALIILAAGIFTFICWLFPSIEKHRKIETLVSLFVYAIALSLLVWYATYYINDKSSDNYYEGERDYECVGSGRYRDCY